MVDIPEHLLQRSAEARAKALGISVEQALAEMKGESDPTVISKEPEVKTPLTRLQLQQQRLQLQQQRLQLQQQRLQLQQQRLQLQQQRLHQPAPAVKAEEKPAAKAPETDTPEEVDFAPEVKVTQRLLTVVKAKPIQKSVSEPVDKVNTWPHLMLPEFVSLMAMTAFLIFLSAILQAPLLEEANPNVTPNPAKAPWYFLGLQELLSYWDPQIAGVMIPLVLGVVLWMAFPYIDRNPETHPSKRKFAIMFYTFFLAGAGVLTIIGVLFRGPGWNWTYPWIDGIWFDDLLDWIHFE